MVPCHLVARADQLARVDLLEHPVAREWVHQDLSLLLGQEQEQERACKLVQGVALVLEAHVELRPHHLFLHALL